MADTFTNQPGNRDNRRSGNSANASGATSIPKRRGSKYADILLHRLQTSVLSELDSALIGMVSFAPRQGVTTTAINLAIRAADHYFTPSLIIDGNFKNHKVTRLYRCTGNGLGDCLNGQASLEQSIKKTKVPGFFALGAGKNKLSKQILFDPDIAGEFFKMVRNDFRFSVIDLPVFNEPSLVESIIPKLDGVVMVARYGARKDQLAKMQNNIRNSGGELLGIVMTGNEDKLPGWLPKFLS